MSQGQNFINVLDDDPTRGVGDPVSFRGEGSLGARLRVIAEAAARRGDIWTLYLSRSAELDRSVTLPRNVALELAPRVVVTLRRDVIWTLSGPTDLGNEPRFALGDGAVVRLHGPLDAVRPIWWNVGGADATDAIESAVATVLDRARRDLPQAFIALERAYWLTRPVTIAWDRAVERTGVEVVIRGRHPVGRTDGEGSLNKLSLRTDPSSALLRTRGAVRLVVEDVGFFEEAATTSVDEGAEALVDCLGEVDGVSLSRCTFVAAAADFVGFRDLTGTPMGELEALARELDSAQSNPRVRQALAASSGGRGSVQVSECVFVQRSSPVSGGGLRVRAGAAVHLRLTTSEVTSAARAMVTLFAGLLQLEDVTLRSSLLTVPPLPGGIRRIDEFPIEFIFPVSKVDPAVGDVLRIDPAFGAPPASFDVLRTQTVVQAAAVALEAGRLAFNPDAQVLLTHVRAMGCKVLDASARGRQPQGIQATLSNVLQRGAETAVAWPHGAGPDALTLLGCDFDGNVSGLGAATGRWAFDVGTRFRMGGGFEPALHVRALPVRSLP
jgi:hypothetical protein